MNKTYPLMTALLLILLAATANAQFNDNSRVLQRWTGLGSFGWALSTLEDINNDGVTEIMVTSIGSASVVVYSGADGAELHRFTRPGSQLGYAIADAGDINADGINDVLAGAVLEPGGGAAFVFSGADGSTLLTLNGENAGDQFGYAVSSAGDVNSDGVPDILVGASQNDNQGAQSGRAYVYSGTDGSLIRRYEAESAGDRFGGGAALLDDLDSDGIPEHIIGAFAAGTGGRAYVYSGASGNLLFTLNPDQGAVNFGQFFVADPGDVDGDGTGDIYVGDFNHAGGAGRVYVFSGADQSVLHRFSGGPGEGAGPGRSAG